MIFKIIQNQPFLISKQKIIFNKKRIPSKLYWSKSKSMKYPFYVESLWKYGIDDWINIFFFFFFTFIKPRRSIKLESFLQCFEFCWFEGQESFVKGIVSLWSIRNLFFTVHCAIGVIRGSLRGGGGKKRKKKFTLL